PDGVAIVSEDAWAFSDLDGGVQCRDRRRRAALLHVPLARGIVKLGGALAPLLARGGGASPRERLVLIALVAAPVGLSRLPHPLALPRPVTSIVALAAW